MAKLAIGPVPLTKAGALDKRHIWNRTDESAAAVQYRCTHCGRTATVPKSWGAER